MTSPGEKFDVKKLDLEGLIFFAKIAEQSERYDDMARAMYEVTNREKKLSQECRNLFSVAYKNVVGARRSSWRVIGMIEQKAETDKHKDVCKAMRMKVEEELDNTCDDVVDQLDGLLAAGEGNEDEKGSAVTTEEKVFYLKMRGDYYRYKAEYKEDKEKDKAVDKAQEAYEKAMDIAKKNMSPTHPNLLGLALNFSVFYYEILNSPEMACKLAKTAFDDAINMFSENQQVDDCKDSTLIMQLLRDNLTLWTSDTGAENGGDVQD